MASSTSSLIAVGPTLAVSRASLAVEPTGTLEVPQTFPFFRHWMHTGPLQHDVKEVISGPVEDAGVWWHHEG
jgi:hypothetical protein